MVRLSEKNGSPFLSHPYAKKNYLDDNSDSTFYSFNSYEWFSLSLLLLGVLFNHSFVRPWDIEHGLLPCLCTFWNAVCPGDIFWWHISPCRLETDCSEFGLWGRIWPSLDTELLWSFVVVVVSKTLSYTIRGIRGMHPMYELKPKQYKIKKAPYNLPMQWFHWIDKLIQSRHN